MPIDETACSGCMLCASACPAEAPRTTNEPFETIMGRLARFDAPLLGCLNGGAPGHDRVACFGELAEEHLTALGSRDVIRFNATRCNDCPNRAALHELRDRIERVEALGLWPGTRLRVETHLSEPEIDELPTERRFMFRRLLGVLPGRAGSLEHDVAISSPAPRGTERRRLLSGVSDRLDEGARLRLAARFRYRVDFATRCETCRRCASICPTGAISRGVPDSRPRLVFDSERCTGCSLCEEFCPDGLVRVTRGNDTRPGAAPGPAATATG